MKLEDLLHTNSATKLRLRRTIAVVNRIKKDPGVRELYGIGSVFRGEATDISDVDLLILVDSNNNRGKISDIVRTVAKSLPSLPESGHPGDSSNVVDTFVFTKESFQSSLLRGETLTVQLDRDKVLLFKK